MNPQQMQLTKPELSCRVNKSLIFYLKDRYDQKTVEQFIGETGLPLSYLEDENNWISFDYNNMLLEKIVEFTKNPMAPFEAGSYVISKESYGFFYSILSVLKIFGSPKIAYQQVAELGSTFNNVCKISVLESGVNQMVMSWKYFPGFKQTRLNCLNIRGQLAYIPAFWGLPIAEIESLKCEAEGDDACVFRIRWKPVPKKGWILIGLISAILAGVTALYFLEPIKWLTPRDLVITALVSLLLIALTRLWKNHQVIEENKKLNVKRSKALEESMDSLQNEFRKLDEANRKTLEEAEKLSILKEIAESINRYEGEKETVKNVLRLLIDRIGFDRGCCLVFNDRYELLEVPHVVRKNSRVAPPALLENTPEDWEKTLSVFHTDRSLKDTGFRMLRLEKDARDSLVMPVNAGPAKKYFFVLDSLNDSPYPNEAYHPFFITVSNQLQVALDRIFAEDAAKSVMASIPSSIAIFDPDTLSLLFCNQSFLDEIGKDGDSIMERDIMEAIGIDKPENREKFALQVTELPMRKLVDFQEIAARNGTFGYTLFLMPELSGLRKKAGIIMKNITSQIELKEQLIRAEKMAALGTLVSGVAHEINNPLYGILGNAEIIRDEAPSEDIREYAKSIIEFSIRASDIVKDLSAYSRSLREEKPALSDLNAVMDEALRIVGYNKNLSDIHVEKHYGKIPHIFALTGELTQIYVNLINNAIDAMKGRGTIKFRSICDDGTILTSVEDTGAGIPKENLSKVFDPFFTTKETGKGTGLGLSIVYRLVTKYDGTISVRSEEGAGTVFDIRFPPGRKHA